MTAKYIRDMQLGQVSYSQQGFKIWLRCLEVKYHNTLVSFKPKVCWRLLLTTLMPSHYW